MSCNFRIGSGYDIHRTTTDRPLILCGVQIPSPLGLLGHSDADVSVTLAITSQILTSSTEELTVHDSLPP